MHSEPVSQHLSINSPEQALRLPEGDLVLKAGGLNVEVAVVAENVLGAAQILITNHDTKELKSQAEVIARAGKHGWGAGDVYLASGEGEIASADKITTINLAQAEDGLKLEEGRLCVNMGLNIEVSFGEGEVLTAAQLLIEKDDAKNLATQAGIIARAGKHGWGQGDIYTTM
jgi:hypothetical protein